MTDYGTSGPLTDERMKQKQDEGSGEYYRLLYPLIEKAVELGIIRAVDNVRFTQNFREVLKPYTIRRLSPDACAMLALNDYLNMTNKELERGEKGAMALFVTTFVLSDYGQMMEEELKKRK